MPDRTGIFLGWSANLSNFLGLWVEAGASPMYPQKMRVPPLGMRDSSFSLGENKETDQLCSDQWLCFRYRESTIPLLHKSENSSV